MPAEIVFVGYQCPLCGYRVAVLRSSDPPHDAAEIASECQCGYVRKIRIEEIQSLEVWKQKGT